MDNITKVCMNGTSAAATTAAAIILLPLSITTFILNLITFIILQKSKKLRENNFVRLLLWLSISDMVLSCTSFITIGNTFLQLQCINIPSLCFITCLLTSLALSCSLIQVLFVCLERLFATISVTRGRIWSDGYNATFGIILVMDAIYVSAVYLLYGDTKSSSCKLIDIFGDKYRYYKLYLPFLNLAILIMISVVYGFVFCRLKKSMVSIAPMSGTTVSTTYLTNSSFTIPMRDDGVAKSTIDIPPPNVASEDDTGSQLAPPKATTSYTSQENLETNSRIHGGEGRLKRFRRSLSTLIIVIITMYGCILPSVLTNILSAFTSGSVPDTLLEFTSIFILLNPLIDPIIYVLRIKEFRSKLRCRNLYH